MCLAHPYTATQHRLETAAGAAEDFAAEAAMVLSEEPAKWGLAI